MSTNNLKTFIRIGDKVIFDKRCIEDFTKETSGTEKVIRDYQQLVLRGIDLEGIATVVGEDLSTVQYADGWLIPVPTKYLILLSTE